MKKLIKPFNIVDFCESLAQAPLLNNETIDAMTSRYEYADFWMPFDFNMSHVFIISSVHVSYRILITDKAVSAKWETGILSLKRNK